MISQFHLITDVTFNVVIFNLTANTCNVTRHCIITTLLLNKFAQNYVSILKPHFILRYCSNCPQGTLNTGDCCL